MSDCNKTAYIIPLQITQCTNHGLTHRQRLQRNLWDK